jgi:hypothetical protein
LPEPVRSDVTSAVRARWQSEVSREARWSMSYARARGHLPRPR